MVAVPAKYGCRVPLAVREILAVLVATALIGVVRELNRLEIARTDGIRRAPGMQGDLGPEFTATERRNMPARVDECFPAAAGLAWPLGAAACVGEEPRFQAGESGRRRGGLGDGLDVDRRRAESQNPREESLLNVAD